MAEMDALMAASLDQSQMTSMGGAYVRNAAIDFTGLAMSDPSLLDEVPTSLLQQVEGTTHPAHSNTNHFLLGPKGCASNPTVGKGIRLAQFDSDYAMRFMFCDVGIVDFWIDPADLADGRWDRAWAATAGG